MSVITKGKTFTNGEQLTAGKLNQMLDAATFSSAAVDNTKTTLSAGAITIAPNAISFTELSDALVNDTDSMSDASATTLATSESIKAYIDGMRPKIVVPTGGTDQGTTGGSAGTGTEALTRTITSGTTDTDFNYNMADFTSADSDFHYKKIIAIVVRCTVVSDANENAISSDIGSLGNYRFLLKLDADADNTGSEQIAINVASTVTVPVNKDQAQFKLRHNRNDDSENTVHSIVNLIIQPNLPTA